VTSEKSAVVNSNFSFYGENPFLGNFRGTVTAQDFYSYSVANETWLIYREIWNYLNFSIEFPNTAPTNLSGIQTVDALSVSPDGTYAAAGTSDTGGYNGSVYLVALKGQPRVVWRHVTNGSTVGSVAISGNGSYVAATGTAGNGQAFGEGPCLCPVNGSSQLLVFNRGGAALWNFTAAQGTYLQNVAMSGNGSKVVVAYTNGNGQSGIICFNSDGLDLWNYTSPTRGSIGQFAMSNDGSAITYADKGVFYLNSQGQQVWNYTEEPNVKFIQMSSNGSRVAVGTVSGADNGSLLYFDGTRGA
jgi:hypothetical protein